MKPIFFKNTDEMITWLSRHHNREKELFVGYYKRFTGKESITWPESVDAALCFGWIDGVRRSIDEEKFMIRFTPRNPGSNWSLVNIEKAKRLIKLNKMRPDGLAAFEKMDKSKAGIYSFERDTVDLDRESILIFRKNKNAWKFFSSMPPSYKKPAINWVMSAKKKETKLRRLNILIENSERGEKVPPLRRN